MGHGITMENIKGFYTNIENLALIAEYELQVEKAAELKELVRGYANELLKQFDFRVDLIEKRTPKNIGTKYEPGCQITDYDDLFLCDGEDYKEPLETFYRALDAEHKRHGFDLQPGFCPALVADSERRDIEREMINAFADSVNAPELKTVYNLERRRELISLIVDGPGRF